MAVLTVEGLHKSYRKGFIPKPFPVLKGVSFSLEPGTVTGFLGANGAGKTTTMKCLFGICTPDKGRIEFFGHEPLSSIVKSRIGFLPEHPYFYDYLTGSEFLRFYGQLSGKISRKELNLRIEKLLKKVDLVHAKDKALRGYSKGMLQKIGIAQALIHNPELVILDEPMSGLDPDGRYYLAEIIREVARQGTTVFFSSHLLPDVESLCANLVILRGGTVLYSGSTMKLLNNVEAPTEVIVDKNGKAETHLFKNIEEVQIFIDQVRRQGAKIIEVQQLRITLEEAFVRVALRGDSE